MMKKTSEFRSLIEGEKTLVPSGAYDARSARIIEKIETVCRGK